jgi:hypothetical protein
LEHNLQIKAVWSAAAPNVIIWIRNKYLAAESFGKKKEIGGRSDEQMDRASIVKLYGQQKEAEFPSRELL